MLLLSNITYTPGESKKINLLKCAKNYEIFKSESFENKTFNRTSKVDSFEGGGTI